jgi:Kef-type K+ transport system membrane component KefB
MILLIYGLSQELGLEPLLSSLVMGVVMANLSKEFFLVKKEFDNHLKDIIFLLFFTISAMHLDINFLLTMPAVVVVYVFFRILGKVIGVYIGGKVSKSDKSIQKYLGLALFPQAGIAIGLALSLSNELGFEQIAPIMLNAIIATTMVHELLGPLFTTYVVKLSGEARVAKDSKKNR